MDIAGHYLANKPSVYEGGSFDVLKHKYSTHSRPKPNKLQHRNINIDGAKYY